MQKLVRFCVYYRIKLHAPPLVQIPVNSFEFQSCDRTPQAEGLTRQLFIKIQRIFIIAPIFDSVDYQGLKSCLLPTLSFLSVRYRLDNCFRRWHSSINYQILPLCIELYYPLLNSKYKVYYQYTKIINFVLLIKTCTAYKLFTPNHSE